MLVDYERVLLDLKRHIATKPHHGQRELALVITELEAKHQLEEDLPSRALRLYGQQFYESVIAEARAPSSDRDRVPDAEGDQDRASRGDSIPSPKEDNDGRSTNSSRGAGRTPSGSRAPRRASRHSSAGAPVELAAAG